MRGTRLTVSLALTLTAATAIVGGQQPGAGLPAFHTAIDLTAVTATVIDKNGALVTGLPLEAFEVFEDGERQTITQFTNQRVPVSLAILLDVSDSMYGRRIQEAREAIGQFVTDLLGSDDEFAMIAFNHQQRLLTPWTDDRSTAVRVMAPIQPFGATAIYDAIVAALPMMETRRRERAAVLVISDGADTASDTPLREVRSALVRSDTFVYAVAIDADDRRTINVAVNPDALRAITDQSGGGTRVVHNSEGLSAALGDIADELNSQYLIGYTSHRGRDGQYHSIRVRVRGTDNRVRARNGYVAEPSN